MSGQAGDGQRGERNARELLGLGQDAFRGMVSLNDEGFIMVDNRGTGPAGRPVVTYANSAYCQQVGHDVAPAGGSGAYPLPGSSAHSWQLGEQVLSSRYPQTSALVHPASRRVLGVYAFPVSGTHWAAFVRPVAASRSPRSGKPRLAVDEARLSATWDGKVLPLTSAELGILSMLARAPGAVLARSDIAAALWGEEPGRQAQLDPHMSRLRRKLAEAGLPPGSLRTWRRRGFALNVPA